MAGYVTRIDFSSSVLYPLLHKILPCSTETLKEKQAVGPTTWKKHHFFKICTEGSIFVIKISCKEYKNSPDRETDECFQQDIDTTSNLEQ